MKLFEFIARVARRSPGNVFLLALIVCSAIGWTIYVQVTAGGVIGGTVVDAAGDPVAGATVELREKTLNYTFPPVRTWSDPDGRFRYEDMDILEFVVQARVDDELRSSSQRHHLVFKGQNYELPEPLVVRPR